MKNFEQIYALFQEMQYVTTRISAIQDMLVMLYDDDPYRTILEEKLQSYENITSNIQKELSLLGVDLHD